MAIRRYLPPAPLPPTPSNPNIISDRQFFQQLAIMGLVTDAEALAAVGTGAIPAAMMSVIDTLPADQQFNAKMLITGARDFNITDPLVQVFAAAQNPPLTQDQLAGIWAAASQL